MGIDNFFDFRDFFLLLKDSLNTHFLNEEIFIHLVGRLYHEANFVSNSPKDDVSDILCKRKPFNGNVRKVATLKILDDLVQDYKEVTLLLRRVSQPDVFIDQVLYRVKQDDYFFTEADYIKLESKRNDLAYVVAYILIRTVSTSNESQKIRHSKNYNPFANYRLPDSAMEDFVLQSASRTVKGHLVQTSRYMLQELNTSRQSFPEFRSELLSSGISYKEYPQKFDFQSTFSITPYSSESKSLDSFLSTKEHLLIIGEGGIGKTTFLYSCLEKHHRDNKYPSIPLYIKLSDCSTNTDHQYMILNALYKKISFAVNGVVRDSFKDILDEFALPCDAESLPEYTLLLDGFNEITAMDFGEIRRSIAKEITELLSYPNVRIILTSRENEFYGLPLGKFNVVRANGIEEDDVVNFLQTAYSAFEVNEIQHNHTLMQYLKIPLFLLMYVNSGHSGHSLIGSRGSILFAYYNGSQSFYNEKMNAEEKTTREAYLMVNVLLDFVLPDLGYCMKQNHLFQISEDLLEDLIQEAIAAGRRFIGLSADAYHRYEQHPHSLKRVLNHFSKIDAEDILTLLRDYLCVITADSNRNLYFAHQYIRDYFCALYCVREFYYLTLTADHQPDALPGISYTWGNSLWDEEQTALIQEILSQPSAFQQSDLLYDTIALFRRSRHYCVPASKYALTNLITVLAQANDGNLFKYDFSDLDLTNCTLANYNFHNILDGQTSSFRGSKIGIDTFAADAHHVGVLKWAVSFDEQHIISIDADFEIRIWNIATQKCITTRKCPPMEGVQAVSSIELCRQNTLALITFKGEDRYTFACATYDFQSEVYTLYLIPNTHIRNIIYFGCDSETNTLIAILDNGKIYRYQVNAPEPMEQLHFHVDRPFSINYFHLLSYNKLLYRLNHIPYIYDLQTGTSIMLTLPANYAPNKIAVSKDQKKIALEAYGQLYIYHSDRPDCFFQVPGKLPSDDIYVIKFCHEDSNILTAYGYITISHLDCRNGNILYSLFTHEDSGQGDLILSSNYRIAEHSVNGAVELQTTNLYTQTTSMFQLSNQQRLVSTYLHNPSGILYSLYNNGTVLSFDADTMKLEDCFNYAPERYISAAAYSEEDNLLCFTSTPNHYYRLIGQTQITLINLSTGEYRKSAPIFGHIENVRLIGSQLIALFTQTTIQLIDTADFSVKSVCDQYDKENTGQKHIFIDGRKIHVVSDFSVIIAHQEYDATVATYVIEDQDIITLSEITHIPCPWQFIEHCSLIYSVLDSNGLALVKAVTPSEHTYMAYRHYEYTTPDESYFRMLYESALNYELMDNWTLASLGNTRQCFGLQPVPAGDVQVDEKFFHPAGDNLICVGNSYYEHRASTQECIPLDSSLFTEMDRLNYSPQKRAIYYNDRHASSIHKYDIDEHRTTHTSNYLHPHILIYGCDFSGCTGERKGIPWYMVKPARIAIPPSENK